MNRVVTIILASIIVVLLTLLGVQGCQRIKSDKKAAETELKYSVLQQKWWKLISTPPRVVTVRSQVEAVNHNPVIPVPLPDDPPPSSAQGSLVSISDSCSLHRYNTTYHLGDSIHIQWAAKAKGYILEFDVLKVSYPSYKTTIDRFIPCDPVDTLDILKKHCKVKNELWIYAKPGMIISPFKVSNVTAGIQWQFKRKWGIGAGTGYDWNINSPIVEGLLLFNLK
jgi:hypothetical protein